MASVGGAGVVPVGQPITTVKELSALEKKWAARFKEILPTRPEQPVDDRKYLDAFKDLIKEIKAVEAQCQGEAGDYVKTHELFHAIYRCYRNERHAVLTIIDNFQGKLPARLIQKYEKLYQESDITPELKQAEALLDDLLEIGPEKPLGYLPTKHIEEALPNAQQRQEFFAQLEKRGIKTRELGGKIYAYHPKTLQSLLDARKKVLDDWGPCDTPEQFIDIIDNHYAGFETPRYDLIADAFGNYAGRGRRVINYAKLFPLAE